MTLPGFVKNIRKSNTNKKKDDDVYLKEIYTKGKETANNYSNLGNRIYFSQFLSTYNPTCDMKEIDIYCYLDCYHRCENGMPISSNHLHDCHENCKMKCCYHL
jgi:hypothetical protein